MYFMKNGILFQEDKGNCINECLKEGYYRDNNKYKNCHSIKILLIGDFDVGKTSLLLQFTELFS